MDTLNLVLVSIQIHKQAEILRRILYGPLLRGGLLILTLIPLVPTRIGLRTSSKGPRPYGLWYLGDPTRPILGYTRVWRVGPPDFEAMERRKAPRLPWEPFKPFA